uniref:Uncharacterized protein n=1 Tax=Rhizophora mucronata TaxID=61149 RepID=A0A2P2LJA4_RHIMU
MNFNALLYGGDLVDRLG